jgi:hypothetical protein
VSVAAMQTLPLSGKIVPQISDNNVDLPEPLSPNSKTDSPSATDKRGTVRENPARPGQR